MKNKLAKGLMWLSAARVLTNLLTFCGTLILARLLTPDDFGLVALATTMMTIVASVTDLSLASALIQHKSPTQEHFSTAWTLNFCRAILIGSIFVGAAPFIADAYAEPRLREILYALGGSILITGLTNPKIVTFNKNLIFWQDFAMTVTTKLTSFIAGIVIAIVYQSYWALVISTVAAQFANVLLSYIIAPFRPRLTLLHFRSLWSFSIWITLTNIVNTLNFKLDHLLIGTFVGRPALGFYTVGDTIAAMPTREVVSPIQSVLFPGFAQMVDEPSRLRHAFRSAQTLLTAIALPLGVGLALIAEPLVMLALGEKWMAAVPVIQIMSGVFGLQTICSPVQALAMAQGRTKSLFQRDLLIFLIRVPFILLGMFSFGLIGVVWGRVIANVIGITLNMAFVTRMIGFSILDQWRANWRSLAAALAMVVVVSGTKYLFPISFDPLQLTLLIALFIAVGSATYVASTALFWIASGKPAGPETEIQKMAKTGWNRVRARRAAQPL